MKGRWKLNRLRKYQKKKMRTKDRLKHLYYADLYWIYHFKVYGPHVRFWKMDED